MKTSEKPIIVEQIFNASIKNLWQALTVKSQMTQWFFEQIKEFKPETGFKTEFMVESGTRKFPHQWKIIDVIPNKKISYDWRYSNYPGVALVTFEMFEQNSKSLLKLTNTVIEDFPDDIPEFTQESCQGGWNYFIKQRLKEYID